jgi:hypothetical protein
MNLGENRIEMRVPRRVGFLAISVFGIPKAFLIEFITRSKPELAQEQHPVAA